MLRLAIVVPTYNEVTNVQNLIDSIAEVAVHHPDTELTVVVIDDSSPDGTAELVERLIPTWKSQNFTVRLINKPTKNGLGAAYIYGFTQLLPEPFDYFLQMDADLSHDPRYISGFIHQAKAGIDFVVASRYIPGGGTPDWTFNRRFLSRGGNFYARTILGRRISDYTGGFNMYSHPLLDRMNIDTITATGYGFLLVLKYRALLNASSIEELPIVFLDRTHGSSKMPRNTLLRNFVLVGKIRLSRGR
jgi:dolichol-phosphate mannosyltransferase